MPIMSYIAYPNENGKEQLVADLNQLSSCDARAALNEDMIILITDTGSDCEEEHLQESLKKVTSLSCLTLVYAESTDNSNHGGEK